MYVLILMCFSEFNNAARPRTDWQKSTSETRSTLCGSNSSRWSLRGLRGDYRCLLCGLLQVDSERPIRSQDKIGTAARDSPIRGFNFNFTLTMDPDDNPALQNHLLALERYKISLNDPYGRASQDVSAVQAHLKALERYKHMLHRTINDILPTYQNPPENGERPWEKDQRLAKLEDFPKIISKVCPTRSTHRAASR